MYMYTLIPRLLCAVVYWVPLYVGVVYLICHVIYTLLQMCCVVHLQCGIVYLHCVMLFHEKHWMFVKSYTSILNVYLCEHTSTNIPRNTSGHNNWPRSLAILHTCSSVQALKGAETPKLNPFLCYGGYFATGSRKSYHNVRYTSR